MAASALRASDISVWENCGVCPVNKPEFVFGLYEKIRKTKTGTKGEKHETIAGLTEEEQILMLGDQYVRNAEELAEGKKLVKEYNIKVEQLSDCAVCHH